MTKNYNEETQLVYITIMISSADAFTRSYNIIKPYYFLEKFKKVVRYILDFSEEYKSLPTPVQIKAFTGLEFVKLSQEDLDSNNYLEWYLKEIEDFCKYRAMELTIHDSDELIRKGNYGLVEQRIKDAMLISLNKNLGLDYYSDINGMISRLSDRSNMVSSGWKQIDYKLFGGYPLGSLNIFCGVPGGGKSLFLQNQCVNWSQMGLNCVYISLELSEELVGMRLIAMQTGRKTQEVIKAENVDLELAALQKNNKWGRIQIKYMPSGTKTNDIKAYLKEYEIQKNVKPNVVAVDYLDLVAPNNARVNPSDLFVKDKFVSEELRSLAMEYKIVMVSASQLNRSGIEENTHSMEHIAGGISKINTADNVMSVYTSDALKQRGEYRIQFLKTRSSSGVGSAEHLRYDQDCLRITDLDSTEPARESRSEMSSRLRRKPGEPAKSEASPPEQAALEGKDYTNSIADFLNKRKSD